MTFVPMFKLVCVHACKSECIHGCVLSSIHIHVLLQIGYMLFCMSVQSILMYSILFAMSETLHMIFVTLCTLVIDAMRNVLNLNLIH